MYAGLLIRIRPNLLEFLSKCKVLFDDIIIFSDDDYVYTGLLDEVILHSQQQYQSITLSSKHSNLNDNEQWDTSTFFSKMYFAHQCDEKVDKNNLPYKHKNLFKLNNCFSKIVIIDDNPLCYRGFEPNAIHCAGFWGNENDNELLNVILPQLETLSNKYKHDFRYFLSGLEAYNIQLDSILLSNDINTVEKMLLTRYISKFQHNCMWLENEITISKYWFDLYVGKHIEWNDLFEIVMSYFICKSY